MMAIPYPQDGEEFRADLKAAGFDLKEPNIYRKIAVTLGRSHQHAKNMASGWNRYSRQARATMKALIDSDNEIVAADPVKTVSDLIETVSNGIKDNYEASSAGLEPPTRYTIHSFGYDRHVLVSVIAEFTDGKQAQIVCDLLNKSDQ